MRLSHFDEKEEKTHPFEVPVYWSVQDAPLGHTTPTRVHAVLSGDVRISIPTPVAETHKLWIVHWDTSQMTYRIPSICRNRLYTLLGFDGEVGWERELRREEGTYLDHGRRYLLWPHLVLQQLRRWWIEKTKVETLISAWWYSGARLVAVGLELGGESTLGRNRDETRHFEDRDFPVVKQNNRESTDEYPVFVMSWPAVAREQSGWRWRWWPHLEELPWTSCVGSQEGQVRPSREYGPIGPRRMRLAWRKSKLPATHFFLVSNTMTRVHDPWNSQI